MWMMTETGTFGRWRNRRTGSNLRWDRRTGRVGGWAAAVILVLLWSYPFVPCILREDTMVPIFHHENCSDLPWQQNETQNQLSSSSAVPIACYILLLFAGFKHPVATQTIQPLTQRQHVLSSRSKFTCCRACSARWTQRNIGSLL